MKVSSINGIYGNYSSRKNYPVRSRQKTSYQIAVNPNFQGNAGKVVGGIAGLIAITAICPAIAMVGLGGIGALAGMAAGGVVDNKIEDMESKKQKK